MSATVNGKKAKWRIKEVSKQGHFKYYTLEERIFIFGWVRAFPNKWRWVWDDFPPRHRHEMEAKNYITEIEIHRKRKKVKEVSTIVWEE